ncbi:MAG: NAD(P)-binding protein, partial [Candidatus Binatia bacterium]
MIGAGPAGLTAALELLRQSNMRVVVLEASGDLGGISKTVNYRGNRIDIGGHRFFSKSDWVMNWWQEILPLQSCNGAKTIEIAYQNNRRTIDLPGQDQVVPNGDSVMLVRDRLSRIYFMGKFFSYPVKMNFDTALKLGPARMSKILNTYACARLFPRRPEISLEDFLLNRFGRELYETFFKDYTEKVWGVPCNEISAEWGAQRIKGLSVVKAVAHALKSCLRLDGSALPSRSTETSLIEKFLYPKYGPGQMW